MQTHTLPENFSFRKTRRSKMKTEKIKMTEKKLLEITAQQQIQFEAIKRLYRDTKLSDDNIHEIQMLMRDFTLAVLEERLILQELEGDYDFFLDIFDNLPEEINIGAEELEELNAEGENLDDDLLPPALDGELDFNPEELRNIIRQEILKYFTSRN